MNLNLALQKDHKFPAIADPWQYTSARIWNSRYSSFAPLAQFENLEELEIFIFPDTDFDAIKGLSRLRILKVIDFPKVIKIDELGNLEKLEEIELATAPSKTKLQHINSLKPLEKLSHLKLLSLSGIFVDDQSLMPLYSCVALEEFGSGNLFPLKELAYLKAAKPYLNGIFLEPTVKVPYNFCGRCGEQKVFLTGVIKRSMKCPICNAKRVAEHIAEWNIYQADFQSKNQSVNS